PMVELEADDALASAAHISAQNPAVERACIWTPDKDLAQCVSRTRVVQVDRKSRQIRDDAGVRAKFGVAPSHIPDYLALVGDAADGYPGIPRIGTKTAARLITRYGEVEQFPSHVLGDHCGARAALQETGDAAYRRSALHRRRGAALARTDERVRL